MIGDQEWEVILCQRLHPFGLRGKMIWKYTINPTKKKHTTYLSVNSGWLTDDRTPSANVMERLSIGFSSLYDYSTPPSWLDDAEGSSSGNGLLDPSYWLTTSSTGGSGSGSLMSDGVVTSSVSQVSDGMIDADGIVLAGMESTDASSDLSTIFFNSTLSANVTDVPPYVKIATTCIMSVILFVGITGNVLVPIVIANSKDLRNSTNVFLVNLALADLLVILICLPTGFVELHSTPGVWYLGETMCKFLPIEFPVSTMCASQRSDDTRYRTPDRNINGAIPYIPLSR